MNLRSYILPCILIAGILVNSCKKKDKDTPPTPSPSAVVSTNPISSISETAAICGGNVTSEGTSAITAVGVCWDTNPSPTTLKPHTNNGAGTGTYTSSIIGLLPGTTYYVRAYATNASGTAYGNEVSFKTNSIWVSAHNGIAIDSESSLCICGNTLFVLGSGGIYKSTDDGGLWTLCNNGSFSSQSLVNMVAGGNNLYAGDAVNNMYLSTDGGNNWSPAGTNIPTQCIVASGNTVIAGSGNSVWVSTNSGANWTNLSSTGYVQSMAFNGSQLYVGTSSGSVFLSQNLGTTWTPVNNGLSSNLNIQAMAISGSNVIAGTSNGIFISTNQGANWNPVSNATGGLVSFAVNGTTVVTSGTSTYLSTDNGTSFSDIKDGLPGTYYASSLVATNNYLVGASSSGMYRRQF